MEDGKNEVAVLNTGSALSFKQVADRVNIVHEVLKRVMIEGTHYGTVPGCGARKVLFKPGADVLALTFRLVPQFAVTKTDLGGGHRDFDVTCSMFGPDGGLLGQGVGSCSTMEKKYRYRKSDRGEKIENEDIADIYNTVLKMAKKRAHVDATLTVTGAGDLFTQDLIDEDAPQERKPVAMPRPTAAKQEARAEEKAKPDKAEPEAAVQIVTGIITRVDVMESKPGAEKTWKKYGVRIGTDVFGTYDAAIGERAQALVDKEVTAEWRQDGKYKTLLALKA